MMKQKLLSVLMLVAIAFTASMVLTGRMRDANEAGAQNRAAQPPVMLIWRGSAGLMCLRSITKSCPFGLRAMASSIEE